MSFGIFYFLDCDVWAVFPLTLVVSHNPDRISLFDLVQIKSPGRCFECRLYATGSKEEMNKSVVRVRKYFEDDPALNISENWNPSVPASEFN